MTYIDGHFPPLVKAYEHHVVKPLTSLGLKHIQDCPSPVVEAKFSQLIETSGPWYSLLLAIDFHPGDTLPFSTALWCLPKESPDAVANSKLKTQTSEIVKTLGGKISASEVARSTELDADKAKEAQHVQRALLKVEEEQAARKAAHGEAERKEKERLKAQFEKRLKEREDSYRQEEEAALAIQNRYQEFKTLVDRYEETGTLDVEELEKLAKFAEDPEFTELLDGKQTSKDGKFQPESIADAINCVRQATLASKMTATQVKVGPSYTKLFKDKSRATPISDVINITNSDDDYKMGDSVIMNQQLHEFPWQSYGLTTDIVAPALHAIKTLQVEDKALFLDDTHVKEILRLGLRAFRNKEAGYADSSNASDGSAKRSCSSDCKHCTSKKRCTMEIDSDTFTKSVSTKKKGKACMRTPVYTSDEDNDELGGDSADVVSHDVGL